MRVAVAGGSGLVGRYVVDELGRAGHEAVVLARSTGVDLISGDGLAAALVGSGALIDVSNVVTRSAAASQEFFGTATRSLLRGAETAGLQHHIALSIVGIDRVGLGYYAGKRLQEQLLFEAAAPVTVLRATQFHEFSWQILGRAVARVVPVPRMLVQPIAAREVAAALVGYVDRPPVGMAPELAGPQVHRLPALSRRLLRVEGASRFVLGVPIPGAAGRAAARGALLPTESGPRGTQSFGEWLAAGHTRGL
jgi:uncharacterized protein YbjT (DUF2867 family)